MSNNLELKIECYSLQGRARSTNQDFTSIYEYPDGVLVSLVDIATAVPFEDCEFVSNLNKEITQSISQESLNDKNVFLSQLRQIVEQLKKVYRKGCASFIIVYIPYNGEQVWGLTVGDARLGLLTNQCVEWVTPVHTGANPLGEIFTEQMKSLPERNLLTRSLNMRKVFIPDVFEIDILAGMSLIIASDGFWAELPAATQSTFFRDGSQTTDDDCSAIIISKIQHATKLLCELNSDNCSYFDVTVRDETK
jgi:serine/threonine protein phosphatase PrpC